MLKHQYVGQYFQKELQSINSKTNYRKLSIPQYGAFEKRIIIEPGNVDVNSKEYIDAYYEFVNVEMDNVSDYDITCKVENLEGLN